MPEILETHEVVGVYTDQDSDCTLEGPTNTIFNQYVINGSVSNNAVIDPITFGGLENAGRLVFVDKSDFTIEKDYPFFEGLSDLCTFSTAYTSDNNIVLCANNSANFDDYAIMEIYPNYGDEDPWDCIPQNRTCLEYESASFPFYETTNPTELFDGGNPDRSTTQTYSRITVKSGTTLTITNITLEISERIIVERNAKLIVENATLTAPCDNLLWTGIEVNGNPSLGHPPKSVIDQGMYPNSADHHGLVIINGSTIQHSINGVKTTHSNQTPLNLHNGIVIVENSVFINNKHSVVLIGNNMDVTSRLLNNQFIIDHEFRTHNSGTVMPKAQVRLKNVSNYKMDDNIFISHQDEFGNSTAIWTDDTDFNLTDSHFTNFNHGIEAYNGLTPLNRQTIVERCTFNDNARSMVFSGYHADIDDGDAGKDRGDFGLFIYKNTVNMRDALQGHFDDQEANWGIRLEACRDYMVSTNDIDGGYQYDDTELNLQDQSDIYTTGYAIQVNDSPAIMDQTNYIQKNHIGVNADIVTALHSGVKVWNDNPTLQILCNDFTNKMFYSENYGSSSNNVPVALNQGSCGEDFDVRRPETAPAGNTFSANTNSTLGTGHRNFVMSGSNSLDVIYNYTGVEPSNDSNNLLPISCTDSPATDCDAYENDKHYVAVSGGGSNNCPLLVDNTAFEKVEEEIQQNMTLLTMYGRQDVSNSIYKAESANEIKELIQSFDVFLSDNELMVLAKKIGDFPVEVLTILEENAPLNNQVLEVLSEAIQNVPIKQRFLIIKNQSMVDNLFENTTGVSLRMQKEKEVAQLATIQLGIPTKYIPQDCIKKIKPEEVLENLVYLSKNTTLNKLPIQQFVLDESIKARNFDLAKETLNQIEIGDNENLKQLVLLKQFEIDMLQAGKTVYDLNKKEFATLKDLAGNNNYVGILARNAILATQDKTTPLFTPETEVPVVKNVKKVANPLLPVSNVGSFVYPNPGNDIITIDITNFKAKAEKLMVKIYNTSGYLTAKAIKTDFVLVDYDISEIPSGTYIVEVTDEVNNLREHTKLIITR